MRPLPNYFGHLLCSEVAVVGWLAGTGAGSSKTGGRENQATKAAASGASTAVESAAVRRAKSVASRGTAPANNTTQHRQQQGSAGRSLASVTTIAKKSSVCVEEANYN